MKHMKLVKILGVATTIVGGIATLVSGWVDEQKMKEEIERQTESIRDELMSEIDAKLQNEKES